MIILRSLPGYMAVFLSVIVHSVTSHPIQSSQWPRDRDIDAAKTLDSWKLDNGGSQSLSREPPQADLEPPYSIKHGPETEQEEHDTLFPQEETPVKSIVSVLVPISPVSVNPHEVYNEEAESTDERINAPGSTNKKYGQFLEHSKTPYDVAHGYESQFQSTSTFRLSTGHYISFFSYRVSLPLMKFFPVSFTSFPLPGIFTTVIVLLVMVWIAILTIGLVEFGNYLWNGRQETREAGHGAEYELVSGDGEGEHELGALGETSKLPLHIVDMPGNVPVGLDEADSPTLSTCSDSGTEPEMEDYRYL